MSKGKSHRKKKGREEDAEKESGSSSSSESEQEEQKLKSKQNQKHGAGKRKKRKQQTSSEESSGSESSSSSSSSISSSSQEKASTENVKHSRRKAGKSKSALNEEHTSPERPQGRSGQQHKSKWDSPDVRRRQRSRSRHRDGRSRERERDRPREWRDYRNNRGARGGYRGYNDRGLERRGDDRQNYGEREGARYRRSSREGRDDRNRYNERREHSRSRSPRREHDNRVKREYSPRPPPQRRNRRNSRDNGDDGKSYEWGKKKEEKQDRNSTSKEQTDKEKPNFGLSGALTEDTNKVNGVVVKYAEPPEARKPKRRWRLYPFKGETALPTLHIHRQSCFLIGRDRKVVDLAVDHPSCSKQHSALQYRLVPFEREDGTQGKRVRLYLIDLESANGTFLNNKKVDARKYYELMEKDVIKFGFSTREYVLLHENSKEDQEDDDVQVKEEPEDNPGGEDP